MERAMEVITVQATAPGVGATFLPVSGDSLTIRDSDGAQLLALWSSRQVLGSFRLTSPLIHDAVVGIQTLANVGVFEDRLGVPQRLTPQDSLVASGSGTTVAANIETTSLLIGYDNLAGINANLITAADLRDRAEDLYGSQNVLVTGGVGGYSGDELLTAEEDQLKANREYAIIGASVLGSVSATATIRYRSPDWGNLGVGMPAESQNLRHSSTWFYDLSDRMGMSTIPVLNASQKSSIIIDAAGSEDQSAFPPTIITHMVLLKKATKKSSKRRR